MGFPLTSIIVMIGLCTGAHASDLYDRQETAGGCSLVTPFSEFIDTVEQLSCEATAGRKDQLRCESCPDLGELQRFTKRQRNDDVCRENLKLEFACKRSPWKEFTIQERYSEVMRLMEFVSTPLPKKVFACIAAKESLYLDPVSITCTDLSGRTTQSGLGHILRSTFADIFGLDKEIIARTREPEKTQLLQKIRERIRTADWLRPYNCSLPAGTPTVDLPDAIFADVYQRDPLVQLAAMAKILQMKSGLKRDADPQKFRAGLPTAVKHYNGSPTKVQYSIEVMKCLNCLEKNGAPVRCLELASKQKYGDGNICKR